MSNYQNSAFHALVHRILVVEKGYAVREVAAQLGMTYAAFYARLSGRGTFSPEEVSRLLQAVPDIRLVDWLLAKAPFMAIARADGADPSLSVNVLEHAMHIAEQALAMTKELSVAAIQGTVDKHHRKLIETHIKELERNIATLDNVFPYFCANPVMSNERVAAR